MVISGPATAPTSWPRSTSVGGRVARLLISSSPIVDPSRIPPRIGGPWCRGRRCSAPWRRRRDRHPSPGTRLPSVLPAVQAARPPRPPRPRGGERVLDNLEAGAVLEKLAPQLVDVCDRETAIVRHDQGLGVLEPVAQLGDQAFLVCSSSKSPPRTNQARRLGGPEQGRWLPLSAAPRWTSAAGAPAPVREAERVEEITGARRFHQLLAARWRPPTVSGDGRFRINRLGLFLLQLFENSSGARGIDVDPRAHRARQRDAVDVPALRRRPSRD